MSVVAVLANLRPPADVEDDGQVVDVNGRLRHVNTHFLKNTCSESKVPLLILMAVSFLLKITPVSSNGKAPVVEYPFTSTAVLASSISVTLPVVPDAMETRLVPFCNLIPSHMSV